MDANYFLQKLAKMTVLVHYSKPFLEIENNHSTQKEEMFFPRESRCCATQIPEAPLMDL
jgi:hypothetical protein